MNREDFKVAVAAANGKPQRLVSIEHVGGREFRDRIDPNSRTSRRRLIHDLARTCGVEAEQLDWLDEAIVAALARSIQSWAAGDRCQPSSVAAKLTSRHFG